MVLNRKKTTAAPDSAPPDAPLAEWALAHVVGRVQDAAPSLEARDVDAYLVHARLADHCRDLGLSPPDAQEFDRQASRLDAEGWRRLALAAATLDDAELRSAMAVVAPRVPVGVQVNFGLLGLALDTAPLTVALVRQSATRAEEFARHLAMRLGVGIVGETRAESRARLNALDYKRLLEEAEQAKAAAQEKMERLRQRQTEAEGRRRRGKW